MALSPEEKREQARERWREWYHRNKEREREKANVRAKIRRREDPEVFRRKYQRWYKRHGRKDRIRDPQKARKQWEKWYGRNKDRVKARPRISTEENRQKACERATKWRLANIERERETKKRWRLEHPEEYHRRKKEEHLRLREKDPDKYRARAETRRAAKLEAGGTFTAEDVARIYTLQHGRCVGCGFEFKTTGPHRYHVDHIIPLKPKKGQPRGTNGPENLQLLCRSCNCQKSNLQPEEWERRRKC
jgi:hypothetical protein